MERLELADVRSRVAKGQQVGGGERFRVTLVEIQSVNHRRAFQHDSHTRMAELAIALCRIESRSNGTHNLHMPANQGQFLSHAVETTIDAARQTFQCVFCIAFFFVARQRSRESRTDCNASTMRIPGGCSGPP